MRRYHKYREIMTALAPLWRLLMIGANILEKSSSVKPMTHFNEVQQHPPPPPLNGEALATKPTEASNPKIGETLLSYHGLFTTTLRNL
jgi:hypothetical protein